MSSKKDLICSEHYSQKVKDVEGVNLHTKEWATRLHDLQINAYSEYIEFVRASDFVMRRIVVDYVDTTQAKPKVIPDSAFIETRPETQAIFTKAQWGTHELKDQRGLKTAKRSGLGARG